jgi:AcrR family transcriptional regulator
VVKRESEIVEEDRRPGLRGRRAVQAEQTRLEILGAARRHFATKGYAATSLKEIAADAGVSVQTVYDSVGSKPDLVRRLNDLIDVEAGVGEIAMAIGTESDPAVLVAIPAKVTRRIVERCDDLVRASFDGARAEPDLAPLADEGGRRHRGGAQTIARRLDELKALDPGLSVEAAAHTIAALSDIRVALILVDDHGFELDHLEEWIATTTSRAVLRQRDNRAPKARRR